MTQNTSRIAILEKRISRDVSSHNPKNLEKHDSRESHFSRFRVELRNKNFASDSRDFVHDAWQLLYEHLKSLTFVWIFFIIWERDRLHDRAFYCKSTMKLIIASQKLQGLIWEVIISGFFARYFYSSFQLHT